MNIGDKILALTKGKYIQGVIIEIYEEKIAILLNDGSQIYIRKEEVI